MIELKQDRLVFRFPDVHADATLAITFQRTLRIPDDGKNYPLPPGLGAFPVRHVDDFGERVPREWMEHGGVMLPMYQSEAMWIAFNGGGYPFAIKVAAGKIDAVTGEPLGKGLTRKPQNYLVTPGQPWLDGFCIGKGVIRQFVAMPLGSGYSAEEQLTGKAEHGGLQIIVHPIKAAVWERMRSRVSDRLTASGYTIGMPMAAAKLSATGSMGLAPGGRMKQDIYHDKHNPEDWETGVSARCFVHLANSLTWRQITSQDPPTVPPTSREYADAGLPWFDYYDDGRKALGGYGILDKLKSVVQMGKQKGDVPLPENESVSGLPVVEIRKGLKKDQVREGRF